MKCCTQAKLALPAGGTPYRQRSPERSRSPPQSLSLNGGLASTKSALRPGMQILMEPVRPFRPEVRLDPANGEVHLGEAPGGGVQLLAEDRDVVALAVMRRDEALRLHEHAARAAARVDRRGP